MIFLLMKGNQHYRYDEKSFQDAPICIISTAITRVYRMKHFIYAASWMRTLPGLIKNDKSECLWCDHFCDIVTHFLKSE